MTRSSDDDDVLRDLGRALPWQRPDGDARELARARLVAAAAAHGVAARRAMVPRAVALIAIAAAAALALVAVRRGGDASAPVVAPEAVVVATGTADYDHTAVRAADGAIDELVRLRGGRVRVAADAHGADRVRVAAADGEVIGRGEFEVAVIDDQLREVAVVRGTVALHPRGQRAIFLAAGDHWRAPILTAALDLARPGPVAPPAPRVAPASIRTATPEPPPAPRLVPGPSPGPGPTPTPGPAPARAQAPTPARASAASSSRASAPSSSRAPTPSSSRASTPSSSRAPTPSSSRAPTPSSSRASTPAASALTPPAEIRARIDAPRAAPPAPIASIAAIATTRSPPPASEAPTTPIPPPISAPTAPIPAPIAPSIAPSIAAAPGPTATPTERDFQRGWALLRAGHLDDAAAALAHAADAGAPAALAADARFFQAVALARAGHDATAATALRQFLTSAPRSLRRGRAAVMLGWNLTRTGDRAGAHAWFEIGAHDPDPAVADAARAGLAATAR